MTDQNRFNSTSEDLLYQILLQLGGGGGNTGGSTGNSAAAFPVTKSTRAIQAITSTDPTLYMSFQSMACNALDIVNNTGEDIKYLRAGDGTYIIIPAGSSRMVTGITNANLVAVHKTGNFGVPVTITAEAMTF